MDLRKASLLSGKLTYSLTTLKTPTCFSGVEMSFGFIILKQMPHWVLKEKIIKL